MSNFKFGDKVWHDVYGLNVILKVCDKYSCIIFDRSEISHIVYSNQLKHVSDWIEIDWVSERNLPETCTDVITYGINGIMVLGLHCEGEYWQPKDSMKEYELWEVTHWQPLPSTPV